MLFNSIAFGVFLPVVFLLYWSLRRAPLKLQNLFILMASYFFYGWWDWRFLSLIVVSSTVDYIIGRNLGRTVATGRRKVLLAISVTANLGLLVVFKYYDFFVTSFCDMLGDIGLHASPHTLSIVLPVGISFYTFQTLSYTIDVYRRELKPTNDVLGFYAFVSFFPQLVAGPIERAHNLLPQFLKRRVFDEAKARDGLRQMLNGFIKKMVIADNLAPLVEDIFSDYASYDGLTLLIGLFLFAMQIYCDFSGYSDIAIGAAKLFGFDLMRNFAYPYFSRDIAEFWRRWHISLSTWFRDYLYMPLCGRKPSRGRRALSIVLTFTICGLWHGPKGTFVIWGLMYGIYFIPMTLARRWKRHIGTPAEGRVLPSFREGTAMIGTFTLTLVTWVFFRAPTMDDAFAYLGTMVSRPFLGLGYSVWMPMLIASVGLLVLEWVQRRKQFMLQIENLPVALRWAAYYLSVIVLLVFGAFGGNQFIYFQF